MRLSAAIRIYGRSVSRLNRQGYEQRKVIGRPQAVESFPENSGVLVCEYGGIEDMIDGRLQSDTPVEVEGASPRLGNLEPGFSQDAHGREKAGRIEISQHDHPFLRMLPGGDAFGRQPG